MFAINDPVIQKALVEPANLGFIKNVLGLTELVIPGEDSRNKQLREIQQLLASAPIVVQVPAPEPVAALDRGRGLDANGTETKTSSLIDSRGPTSPESHGGNPAGSSSGATQALVLPSVPVDQLLDDHATEFEECKRWANSDAGQAAHMTNPAGFANVRAHAEAHLRAMQPQGIAQQLAAAPSPASTAAARKGK
jgi:hypothetical protein